MSLSLSIASSSGSGKEHRAQRREKNRESSCAAIDTASSVCTDEFGVLMRAVLAGTDAGSDGAGCTGKTAGAAQGSAPRILADCPKSRRAQASEAVAPLRLCSVRSVRASVNASYNFIVEVFLAQNFAIAIRIALEHRSVDLSLGRAAAGIDAR